VKQAFRQSLTRRLVAVLLKIELLCIFLCPTSLYLLACLPPTAAVQHIIQSICCKSWVPRMLSRCIAYHSPPKWSFFTQCSFCLLHHMRLTLRNAANKCLLFQECSTTCRASCYNPLQGCTTRELVCCMVGTAESSIRFSLHFLETWQRRDAEMASYHS
jgi:hypothetical protein